MIVFDEWSLNVRYHFVFTKNKQGITLFAISDTADRPSNVNDWLRSDCACVQPRRMQLTMQTNRNLKWNGWIRTCVQQKMFSVDVTTSPAEWNGRNGKPMATYTFATYKIRNENDAIRFGSADVMLWCRVNRKWLSSSFRYHCSMMENWISYLILCCKVNIRRRSELYTFIGLGQRDECDGEFVDWAFYHRRDDSIINQHKIANFEIISYWNLW